MATLPPGLENLQCSFTVLVSLHILYSCSLLAHPPSVGVVAGTILPHLANRDRRLMGHNNDIDGDAEVARLRDMVRQWRIDAARAGRPLKLPVMPFLLRNIWTGALLFFSFLTFMTFFISTVVQATIFISLVGICWAVAMWVPFAIIMEVGFLPVFWQLLKKES